MVRTVTSPIERKKLRLKWSIKLFSAPWPSKGPVQVRSWTVWGKVRAGRLSQPKGLPLSLLPCYAPLLSLLPSSLPSQTPLEDFCLVNEEINMAPAPHSLPRPDWVLSQTGCPLMKERPSPDLEQWPNNWTKVLPLVSVGDGQGLELQAMEREGWSE